MKINILFFFLVGLFILPTVSAFGSYTEPSSCLLCRNTWIQDILDYIANLTTCTNCTYYNITNVTNNTYYGGKIAFEPELYENATHIFFNDTWSDNRYIQNYSSAVFDNLTVNQTILRGTESGRKLRILDWLYPSADGYKMVYDTDFEAVNDDWMGWYKTDQNDVYPDGGIFFGMANATHNLTVMKINGNSSVWFKSNITAQNLFANIDWSYIQNKPYRLNDTYPQYLYDSSGIAYFNETKLNSTISYFLASTTYYPNTTKTYAGTSTTSNLTLLWYYDDHTWNITEGTGASPLDFRINYTGVTDFNQILMRERYLGGSGHEIIVYLWDYDDSTWESYDVITDQAGQVTTNIPVLDPSDHISAGKVQLRFFHTGTGISSHRLYIDYVQLIDGYSAITNVEHDSLSGRDEDCINHPWVCENFNNKTNSYNTSEYWSNLTTKLSDYLLNSGDTATGNYSFSSFFYIDSTNRRIGIRRNPSLNALEVNGTIWLISTTPTMTFTDTDTGADSLITASSSVGGFSLNADNNNEVAGTYFAVSVDGSETLRVNSNKDLGVGATSPTERIHAKDTTDTRIKIQTDSTTVNENASLSFIISTSDTVANTGAIIQFRRTNSPATADGDLLFYTRSTTPSIKMRLNSTGDLNVFDNVKARRFESNVTTGTSPLTVASTTLVSNLNSDQLDSQHGSYYQNASNLNSGKVPLSRLSYIRNASGWTNTTNLTWTSKVVYINTSAKSTTTSSTFQYWRQEDNTSNVYFNNTLAFGSGSVDYYVCNNGTTYNPRGDLTFLFFDNFTGSSLNASKWTSFGTPNTKVSGGVLNISYTSTGTWRGIETLKKFSYPVYTKTRFKYLTNYTYPMDFGFHATSAYLARYQRDTTDNLELCSANGAGCSKAGLTYSLPNNIMQVWELFWNSTRVYGRRNNSAFGSTITTNILSYTNATIRIAGTGASSNTHFGTYDWVIAGKDVAVRPTITKTFIGPSCWKVTVNDAGSVNLQGYTINVTGINLTGNLRISSTATTYDDSGNLILRDYDGICIHNPESSSESVSCSSDSILKTAITDATSQIKGIMNYDIKEYIVKESGEKKLGVIAQELQKTMPERVKPFENILLVEQPNIWEIVKYIQELYTAEKEYISKVDTLEKELAELKEKLEKATADICKIDKTYCEVPEVPKEDNTTKT